MQQQNDWYTGIDYFQSYKEQDIQVEEQSLAQPVPLTRHERVELWYVLKGDGDILVNGVLHTVQQDSFLCLYAHHLYEVSCVRKPLRVLRIQFYIGLFMHAMWEKHPRGRNASLVYETPACLRCADSEVLQLFHRAQQESYGNAFGSRNMLMYIVLQIHMLFCRYALQESMEEEQSPVWKLIKRTIVASQEHTTLQDAAAKLQLHPRYLNQKIKDACGYSFTQLRSFGKIINACALLHFEDLSISYIVDLLSYSSTAFTVSFRHGQECHHWITRSTGFWTMLISIAARICICRLCNTSICIFHRTLRLRIWRGNAIGKAMSWNSC